LPSPVSWLLSLVLSLLLLAPSAHFRGRGGRALGDCGEKRGTICEIAAPRAAVGHSYAEERERDGGDRSIEGPAVAEARARVSLAARAAVRGATIAARPSERRQRVDLVNVLLLLLRFVSRERGSGIICCSSVVSRRRRTITSREATS